MIPASDLTLNQKAVLLSLAALPPRYQHDRVFFEKFLFLVTKSDPEELPAIDSGFEAWKIGPYNEYVDEILGDLQDFQAVTPDRMELTAEGRAAAAALVHDPEAKRVHSIVEQLSSALESMDVDDLLFTVYKLFPEFASRSEIKERIHSRRLEHIHVPVSKIPDRKALILESDKGTKVRVLKEGHRIVISSPT